MPDTQDTQEAVGRSAAGNDREAPRAIKKRGNRRALTGVVTSDKMDKTVVVSVTRRVLNQRFGKYETKRSKYKAHSKANEFHVGDRVTIVETRPLSKDKRWRVEKLVERARQA